ncbi:DUF4131 domain-containing protein [Sneathiella sp. P13V-1]|uniref:ComEC/Rec2 family competence protein n=1 Tax=Sneathiella sp. P13V-1 TaxID=2697366 RepID=UPI00187B5479|nr:ComEC/Rec2 family competence protein [Sneathiella sp. P13V-1]MBE7637560.1 DUF4131 domain-containing protein [Sneathiella sp. P13V-1]
MPALFSTFASLLYADRARWVLWAPVFFAGGIALYFTLPFELEATWMALLPVSIAVYLTARYRDLQLLSLLMLMFVLFVGGISAAKLRQTSVSAPVLDKRTFVEMTAVVSSISASHKGRKVVLENIGFQKDGFIGPSKVRLSYRLKGKSPKPGDRVKLSAFLSPPPLPAYPGGFDFQRQLYFQGIGAVGFVTKLEILENQNKVFASLLEDWRFSIGRAVEENSAEDVKGFLLAITTGERNGLDKQTLEDMRGSGLAHLIAISGLHMGMVGGLIFFVLRFAGALIPRIALTLPLKKIAASVAIIGLVSYLALSGMSISAFRAFVMISLVFLAICFDRTALSYRNLAIAAMVVLLFKPESLLGASFQMSFSAVFCLIAIYQEFGQKFLIRGQDKGLLTRFFYYLIGVLATSVIASLATAPFAIYHFGQVATLGVVANMIAVPVMGFWVMPWVLISLLLYPIGLMDYPLSLAGAGVEHIQAIAKWAANFDFSTLVIGSFSDITLVALVLSVLWFAVWRSWIRYAAIIGIVIGVAAQAGYQKPDLLVSNSGNTVMVVSENELLVSNIKTDKFDREKWKVYLGRDVKPQQFASNPDHEMKCDPVGCVFSVKGSQIAVSYNPYSYTLDCAHSDILISNAPIGGECENPDYIIDRFDMWRNGAHALYINDKEHVIIETVNGVRGHRPWVPQKP